MEDFLNEVEINPMTVDVLDKVLEIERKSYPNPWSYYSFYQEITSNKVGYYITCNWRGEIIGYAGMWLFPDEAHITNIAVAEKFRRHGVGEKLLKHLISCAAKHNIKSITLDVRERNIPAISLYTKCGFKTVGIRKNYYQDTGESCLIMWREE